MNVSIPTLICFGGFLLVIGLLWYASGRPANETDKQLAKLDEQLDKEGK